MDNSLYDAAIKGKIKEIVDQIKDQPLDQVRQLLTPNKNTILHLTSQFGHTETAQAIISEYPSLLTQVNSDDDRALHFASRSGHSNVVNALVDCAKKLDHDVESGGQTWQNLSSYRNKEGDTALHEATRYNRSEVVSMLLKENDGLEPWSNKSGESLLYLAASRGFHDLVTVIIRDCKSPGYKGPMGRTALHGAVICNNIDCTRKLLEWRNNLASTQDNYSRPPLYYAASLGFANVVRDLLSADESMAYVEYNKKNTVLLIAASGGHVSIVKELISRCPILCEIVNIKRRNMLHVAIENEQKDVIEYLLEECPTISSLIIQKDRDGNTPLHLVATLNFFVPKLIQHPLADKGALNNNNKTPLELVNYDYRSSTPAAKSEIAEELKHFGVSLNLHNASSSSA